MMRRKERPMKASDHPGLPLAKPERRSKQKRREERQLAEARDECRRVSFHRAGGRCEHCGEMLYYKTPNPFKLAHVHEEPPRSLGGDPTDPTCTVCVCWKCHEKITRHELDVILLFKGVTDISMRGLAEAAERVVKFQPRLPECTDHERYA
jgi:hypothetical protein